MTGRTILFVCTGNRYRSPIAERLLTARLTARLGPEAGGYLVGSAGVLARPGAPLDPWTAAVLTELGGAPEGFLSRRLDASLIACADLVLGLTREHREAAVRLVPRALRRCFVLEEFVRLGPAARGGSTDGEPGADRPGLTAAVTRAAAIRGRTAAPAPADADDIADPEPRPAELLRACAAQIDRAVSRLVDAVS